MDTDISHWNWNFSDICPTGIRPWIANSHDLAPCFQKLVFQLPMYVLLAVISSYYCGSNRTRIIRNDTQKLSISFRILFSFVLGFLAAVKILYFLKYGYRIYPIDILLSCTQTFAWIVHIGFLYTLKKSGTISHRGPLILVVIWTSLAVLSAIWLHTTYLVDDYVWSSITFSFFVGYGLTLIRSGSSHAVRTQRSIEDERRYLLSHQYVSFSDELSEEQVLGPAQDEANIFSRFVFYWVGGLIAKGEAGKLKKNDDLFDLPESLNIPKITDQLYSAIQTRISLFKALHKCFGFEFYLIGILRLLADLSGFAGPLLLGQLLRRTTDEDATADFDVKSYLYALGLFVSSLITTFAGTHFNWRMTMVSLKMRMSLVTSIYRKTLEAKGLQNSKPEILNLMSTDCDRIVNSCISFHSFWSIPFQLFTTLYLLYTQLGVAFVAGVVFATLLIPLNRFIAMKIATLSQGLMAAKDSRISITTETLSGAKQIKINAWEDVFIKKIEKLREDEVSFLAKRKYLDALCVYFWATTPVLICLLTFGTYVLMGKTLDASTVYTSVALLNMLIGPLNAFPWVLNGLAEAWVSLRRVQELINLPNFNLLEYYKPLHKYGDKKPILSIQKGTFEFEIRRSRSSIHLSDHEVTDFRLDNLNLEINDGELVCLEGPVGGGKSSLLNAILGNLKSKEGHVYLSKDYEEGFGYVAQSPWLQRGTIRDNILWGLIYEERKYKAVIHACALLPDLEDLGGDGRGIGEQGRTLSGGQKARVALARAVYQDKNIYLLDDILSAVDGHVATHIIKHIIFGLLKHRTRIVVTENMQLLNQANQILHVENGIVTNSDIMNNLSIASDYDDEADSSISFNSKDIYHAVDFGNKLMGKEEDTKSDDSILLEESREYGFIDKKVITAYWKATTPILGSAVLITVVLMQVSRNLTDFWLAYWVSHSAAKNNGSIVPNNTNVDLNATNNTTIFYLGIYAGFAVGNSIITLIRAFLFAYAGIRAAKFIHNKLMNSVMFTKMQFFDITPLGRILNRFSSDVYTIDDSLPFILNILLAQFAGLIGALSISLYSMPWLLLLVIPLCPIYLNLQNKYRHSSRDIRRLSSNALSPLYALFTETLQGLTTIRAMRGEKRFRKNFQFKLEESLKAQLSASAAQQWLGLRIQLLGAVLVGGSGLLAAITTAHLTSPEFVGLTISYSLSITSLLSGFLNAVAETEQEFVAVERVDQYSDLEKEKNAQGSADPPFGWPYQGEIEFNDVYLKYREHLPYALKGITNNIQPCEKVGIVGRTGAGKSSLVSSILRAIPITKGTITIDHVNIATLALDVLRTRVAVVSQEPFLFNGTVKENLDPRGLYLDNELWDAITSCLVSPLVQSLGGLSAKIDTGGSNLSAGQKQLLCLTRAMLKRSKIVLVDEGTANLDYESETAIQIVLKNQFKARTVLVIAHRLSGLNHADRILCMKNGEICEEGTPYNLSNNSETYFYSMLQEQQSLGPHDRSDF